MSRLTHADPIVIGLSLAHFDPHQGTGSRLDDSVRRLDPHDRSPETLLPDWALGAYRSPRGDG